MDERQVEKLLDRLKETNDALKKGAQNIFYIAWALIVVGLAVLAIAFKGEHF